jgi:plasmid maintenance system antidote protein VapI
MIRAGKDRPSQSAHRRSISPDTALRLARFFGTSAQMWMNLQAKYDLELAEDALGARIETEVQPMRLE